MVVLGLVACSAAKQPDRPVLDVELFGESRDHLFEKLDWIPPHRPRQRYKLQYVHAALRALDQRYERLVLAHLLRHLCLVQTRSLPSLEQNLHKVFVSAGENRFGQASLD